MKTKITLFALLLFASNLFSQKFVQEWYNEMDVSGDRTCASAITTTSDGNLFISGWGHIEGYGSVYFMKADTAGQPIFTTYIEEQYNDGSRWISRVIVNKQNNFVTIGSYGPFAGHTFFNQISPDGVVLNTTIKGEEYGFNGWNAIAQTADSGYLVAGWENVYGQGKVLAIRQLDKNGTFTFDTAFVDADTNLIRGWFTDIESINDSTFVLTGKRDYIPGSLDDLDYLLAKVQIRDDTIRLSKLVIYQQEGTDERANDLLILPGNQGYIICGSEPNPNSTSHTMGSVFKTDTAGNMIWKKTYSRTLNSNTSFGRVHLDNNGDILVMASTSAGSGDISLLKYSQEGEMLQKTHFDYGINENPHDFTVAPDGKIYIAGSLWSFAPKTAVLIKVKDICPVNTPQASLDNDQPDMGTDITVIVANTNDAWEYKLIQINGEVTLGTAMGNGGDVDFTVSGLTNEDVADGLVVSVVEPGVDCIKYSDTLHLEFMCPLESPQVNLATPTPYFGEDVIIDVLNTNDAWRYNLIQINQNATLANQMGTGSNFQFTVSGLTNEDVVDGLVVSVTKSGVDCIEYSDTLYVEFIDGIEDNLQNDLLIKPNPFCTTITITNKNSSRKITNIAIYNTQGISVFNKPVSAQTGTINLAAEPNGLYIMKITDQSGKITYFKIIKKINQR